MRIAEVISFLESVASPSLQESYDNAGLIVGDADWECKGILCTLDATEEVIREAVARGCNLVVAHHPIIFRGLKRVNGANYVERAVIYSIKQDVAIYAIHTNLDNVSHGVNGKIAEKIGLKNCSVLSPKPHTLSKLYTFVPLASADGVRDALFEAGAGDIGDYSECSFNLEGRGTFKAGEAATPHVGEVGTRHEEEECKIEVVFPTHLKWRMIVALWNAHPYEEPAYDVVDLANPHPEIGAGAVGELDNPMEESEFLALLQGSFSAEVVRHSPLLRRPIRKVAVCGGAGSFLISNALQAGVDAFVTADLKYHEFFDADGRLLLVDIGHFESERFTIDLLQELLLQKFLTFAVLKTEVETNPVRYFHR